MVLAAAKGGLSKREVRSELALGLHRIRRGSAAARSAVGACGGQFTAAAYSQATWLAAK